MYMMTTMMTMIIILYLHPRMQEDAHPPYYRRK